jgi:cob(I)alamin adenosyltransferase
MAKKKTRLYTRTGDQGYTHLLGKEQVPKHDLRPEAYGAIDEASSFMGLVRAEPGINSRTNDTIQQAQRDLWILMGELAATPEVKLPKRLETERIHWLETEIDWLGDQTPPLTAFVLPGDTRVGALLDVARTVVRRAERGVARLAHEDHLVNPEILRYLNRLSSLLFALARYEEHLAGKEITLAKDIK